MACRYTRHLLASRAPRRPRLPWLSPALASHQQLDAGIAARHQVDRKNLKKSKRPFTNYFRTEYHSSPSYSLPVVRTDGHISSYNVVQLMTDPRRSWTPFWGRATAGVRTHGKRQDVVEPSAPQFGDDNLDRIIARLLELRFRWDREDDVLTSSLVPPRLRAMAEHCLPFAPDMRCRYQQQRTIAHEKQLLVEGSVKLEGKTISISGLQTCGRRKQLPVPKGNLGFSGVDTVPTIVLDATRGPLLSSPTETSLSLRWKATNREAASVSEMLRLHQGAGRVPIMGIPARSLLLLLKAHATAEVETPSLDVALAIAAAEHYHEYTYTECLELLRCLRRIAYVRGLARLPDACENVLSLYRDATRCQMFFSDYISDAAPFLLDRVWSRLPEHVQRLTRRRLFLDFTDLLSLAVELHGWRLPSNLPNTVSSAMYTSKYLFLRYTLQLDEATMTEHVKGMIEAAKPGTSFGSLERVKSQEEGEDGEDDRDSCVSFHIMWLCVSLLVRLTAEALGDVLRHVETSIKQHMELAKEYEMATATQGECKLRRLKVETDLHFFLDRIALARPRRCVYHCIGRRQPKKLRLRVIPFEAFPEIFRHIRLPFEAQTRQAHISTARQRAAERAESPLATVLSRSTLVQKHIDRACGALDWGAMMLTQCTCIVRRLPTPAKRVQRLERPFPNPTSPPPSSSFVSNSKIVGDRLAWCEGLVRSRVQSDIDCLFVYIPWQGLEEKLELQALSEDGRSGEVKRRAEDILCASDACFLADLLITPKGSSNTNRDGDHSKLVESSGMVEEQRGCPTSAEQHARKLLESLQDSVERFQMAVADLIDVQEEYFLMV